VTSPLSYEEKNGVQSGKLFFSIGKSFHPEAVFSGTRTRTNRPDGIPDQILIYMRILKGLEIDIFTAIWYNLWPFGLLFPFRYVVPRKI
jgi:hypothetical protein